MLQECGAVIGLNHYWHPILTCQYPCFRHLIIYHCLTRVYSILLGIQTNHLYLSYMLSDPVLHSCKSDFSLLQVVELQLTFQTVEIVCRECGLQSSATLSDDTDICVVCLERTCTVAAEGLIS